MSNSGINKDIYSEYNNYAWFWNKYWGRTSARKVLPVLKEKFFPYLPEGSEILDVCCGTGQLGQLLSRGGFVVSGIDGSREMIELAKQNCPTANLIVGDIRDEFGFDMKFHGACSFFDSLNHILSLDELQTVFYHISDCLLPNGRFIFDLNMEQGYKERWNNTFHIIQGDHVCIDRMSYNVESKIGENEVTLFLLQHNWERMDIKIVEKCYSAQEIEGLLSQSGFVDIEMFEAFKDFGFKDEIGRYYISCKKKS